MQFLRSRSNKHERKFKRMNDKCFGNATRCKVSTAISNSTFQTFTIVLSTLIENIFNSQEKTMKIVFRVYNWIIRGHFFSQSGLVFSRLFNSKTEAKATLICFQKAHWRFGLFSPFHTNMFSFRSAFFLTHFCLKRCGWKRQYMTHFSAPFSKASLFTCPH